MQQLKKPSNEPVGELTSPRGSAFNKSVLSLLENIEYRRCDSGEDLESVFRLRYDSYLQAGMLKPDASHMVTDAYDGMANAYIYGVFYDGELVSTIRLHYANREFRNSPSITVFQDVLGPRLAAGESFVDPSRFAASSEWSRSLRILPYITLRLAVVACQYFRPTYCLTAIKEEHAAFYNRIFRSEAATEPRHYPGLTVPVNLFQSRCSDNMQDTIRRFPFFSSTPLEQRLLFRRPQDHRELAPLTILPTARRLLDAA